MEERKIVVKFGGSNQKSGSDLQKIVKIIQAYNRPLVVVISAFYGITETLLNLIQKKNKKDNEDFITQIKKQKVEIINRNIHKEEIKNEAIKKLFNRIDTLKNLLDKALYSNETYIEDSILSYGELFSSLLLNYILKDNCINSKELLPEQIGLITDGKFRNASVNLSKSAYKVKNSLADNLIFVIPGFYGISPKKEVTLLGRGGSDYSAASIANCINAQSLDVWKDVDGFMSANPKIIKNAQKIDSLTYAEAAELAYFGAKILHPETIEPLQIKNIPLRIFNIKKQTNSNNPKSIINGNSLLIKDRIKSVTYSEDFAILKLEGAGVGIKPGILAKIALTLDNQNINIKSVITSQITINLLLSKHDIKKAAYLINKLNIQNIKNVISITNITLVAAIGEGITEKEGIAAKVFSTVADKGINVQMIAFGASKVASYFIVDLKDKEKTIKTLHEELFSEQIKEGKSLLFKQLN